MFKLVTSNQLMIIDNELTFRINEFGITLNETPINWLPEEVAAMIPDDHPSAAQRDQLTVDIRTLQAIDKQIHITNEFVVKCLKLDKVKLSHEFHNRLIQLIQLRNKAIDVFAHDTVVMVPVM